LRRNLPAPYTAPAKIKIPARFGQGNQGQG